MTENETMRAPLATRTEVQAPTAAPEVVRLLHVEDNAADALLAQEYLRDVLPGAEFDTATRRTRTRVLRIARSSGSFRDEILLRWTHDQHVPFPVTAAGLMSENRR